MPVIAPPCVPKTIPNADSIGFKLSTDSACCNKFTVNFNLQFLKKKNLAFGEEMPEKIIHAKIF